VQRAALETVQESHGEQVKCPTPEARQSVFRRAMLTRMVPDGNLANPEASTMGNDRNIAV
jgi:hypothetical protein